MKIILSIGQAPDITISILKLIDVFLIAIFLHILAGSDRVEKRLRFLTIVSMITLPLGLIAGLLGMNVGGLPGTSFRFGFLVVVVLMIVIGLLQYWYFKRNGWFD